MKMIVGLGNIGKKYENTRHNAGFMVVDEFAREHGGTFNKEKFNASLAEVFVNGEKVILVKPMTYMNESGRAVRPLMDYFDLDLEDLVIINDDLDLQVGMIRLRQKGSAGGHNGIKSLIQHLGTEKFARMKLGIGRPERMSIINWVLSDFTKEEQMELDIAIQTTVKALNDWVADGDYLKLMNNYNRKA
ncbi:aminoacyl-tRNA hydrolase [Ligilactobacillus ceti]|uniref:Peptidyl-tRNA hydrolase n=1 Tax=Ligilactobacillus ceti DSM 22408 TaxID=1122146 RepID=A0A0R2KSX9_9LACO|nr:aminoacyl-tRNA hydrolase [Ligilactobacillus ceti]KRN89252.1 peptidyl-trna hydrolase (pth) [Ligilactobacillus ceti DSM 22408]